MELKAGDPAPDFALEDQHGKTVTLSALRGKKVILYFYPRADTPGCTTQACSLRDAREALDTEGATVIGISPDKPGAQEKFDTKYGPGFPLLSDPDQAVADASGGRGRRSTEGETGKGAVQA